MQSLLKHLGQKNKSLKLKNEVIYFVLLKVKEIVNKKNYNLFNLFFYSLGLNTHLRLYDENKQSSNNKIIHTRRY